MSKYYRKVMCSDEMPKEHKVYSTNKGDMLFVAKDKMFGKRLYGGIIVSYPEWWLEKIELPSVLDALKDLTIEQIEELKVWLKTQSTTLMFEYVTKNRLLETENERLKNVLKEIGNTFKPKELSMWDFVDILRDKAKQALNGK